MFVSNPRRWNTKHCTLCSGHTVRLTQRSGFPFCIAHTASLLSAHRRDTHTHASSNTARQLHHSRTLLLPAAPQRCPSAFSLLLMAARLPPPELPAPKLLLPSPALAAAKLDKRGLADRGLAPAPPSSDAAGPLSRLLDDSLPAAVAAAPPPDSKLLSPAPAPRPKLALVLKMLLPLPPAAALLLMRAPPSRPLTADGLLLLLPAAPPPLSRRLARSEMWDAWRDRLAMRWCTASAPAGGVEARLPPKTPPAAAAG